VSGLRKQSELGPGVERIRTDDETAHGRNVRSLEIPYALHGELRFVHDAVGSDEPVCDFGTDRHSSERDRLRRDREANSLDVTRLPFGRVGDAGTWRDADIAQHPIS